MKPVKQTIMHDPDSGKYGDCQRACVASLLELPIEDVPHFGEGDPSVHEFYKRINKFLRLRGLSFIDTYAVDFSSKFYDGKCDVYHMIYGKTVRGFQHAVVAMNGKIVHDPHPSNDGLLESERENWTHRFLIRSF